MGYPADEVEMKTLFSLLATSVYSLEAWPDLSAPVDSFVVAAVCWCGGWYQFLSGARF